MRYDIELIQHSETAWAYDLWVVKEVDGTTIRRIEKHGGIYPSEAEAQDAALKDVGGHKLV